VAIAKQWRNFITRKSTARWQKTILYTKITRNYMNIAFKLKLLNDLGK